jgi:CRISPR-associated protein Cmr5
MITRAQKDMKQAYEDIISIRDKDMRTQYGRLCHGFPIMVLTCGLCQGVAFSMDKATPRVGGEKSDNRAHRLLLEHAAGILGCERNSDALMRRVQDGDVRQYMLDTRRVLRAWVYRKRFAVSILNVEANVEANIGSEGEQE